MDTELLPWLAFSIYLGGSGAGGGEGKHFSLSPLDVSRVTCAEALKNAFNSKIFLGSKGKRK